MNNQKVKWSPNISDLFLTYGTKVHLYKVVKTWDDSTRKGSPGVKIAENTYALQQSSALEIPMTKTVSWYPKPEPEKLVAVGLANGKIVLTSFDDPKSNDYAGKEFVPKHVRTCIYLEWNPADSHLIAEGLEKYRNDSCINIWNINHKSGNEMGPFHERQRLGSGFSDSNVIHQPYAEIGSSETTASFSWFPKEPRTFVTGMNARYLRIFDLRDYTRPHAVAQTKAIKGVCTDPRNQNRLASFYENHVCIWDVRNFDKPILTFQEQKTVSKVGWCPTRIGFLAVLCQENITVRLYDIQHSPPIGADDLEQACTDRFIQPINNQIVTSFSWHPTHENRMLTITNGGLLRDIIVYERIPMMWSSLFHLTWACGKNMRDLMEVQDCLEADISVKMKQRAVTGYGLHSDQVWQNVFAVRDEPHLFGLWRWLSLSREMTEDIKVPKSNFGKYKGIKSLLRTDMEHIQGSKMIYLAWQAPEAITQKMTVKQFTSDERSKALQLCGWGGDRLNRDLFDSILQDMQMNGEYSKAAALALFNLKVGKAIDILSNASSSDTQDGSNSLNTVAMALAGFTEERQTLWRKTCGSLLQKLRDPYLRAMFSFLSGDRDNFDDILGDPHGMLLADKVAFACLYLSDEKLDDYIGRVSRKMVEDGDLDGLLLTGLTNEGVELLQRYIDITGDIQTVALACVYSFPCDMAKDLRVKDWIECYRELLDRWSMWHHRAKFDIIRHANDSGRIPSQAFVSCNFCGKSIACNMPVASRKRPYMIQPMGTMSSTKPKITCCPGCRKPLPRCSLCLMNLGTPSGSELYHQKEKSDYNTKLSPIKDWFTWCQTCRHGGHSEHLQQWFAKHLVCPVTGCDCKCATLDHISRFEALTIT